MADDPTKRSPQDAQRISLSEAHEVAYWTKALGVTKEQLAEAVKAVGPMAKDVRAKLKGP
ncbi:DUF3606 domain-containing protein [Roseococcus sp. DSY-14]|uniref:DUF3606 domain-containing protein n=1 Tax=Roseococcus sp. DSY-14 TaxID=3369650 RepID=UPI00387B5098